MSLVKELEDRIAQFKAEVEELEKRKRILSARILLLEKALHTEKDTEVDWLDGEPTASKAQAVREIIQSRGQNGATTADVREGLDQLGYSLKRNLVYSTLARLREDGEITKKGDLYFWNKTN